jgi:hypothetical protein
LKLLVKKHESSLQKSGIQSNQRFERLARPLQYLDQPGTIPDESWLSFPYGLREKVQTTSLLLLLMLF